MINRFGILYLIQGFVIGYFTLYLVAAARRSGMDDQTVAAYLTAGTSAWALKPVWTILFGPISDKVRQSNDSRRITVWFVILLTPIFGGLFLAETFLHNSRMILNIAVVLCATMAILDVLADGLAVDSLQDGRKAWGNAVMWGMRAAGSLLGGGAMVWLRMNGHRETALVLISSVALVGYGGVWRWPTGPDLSIAAEKYSSGTAFLRAAFQEARDNGWLVYCMCLVAVVPSSFANVLIMNTLRSDGWLDEESFALIRGIDCQLATIAGALLGGSSTISRLGTWRLPAALGFQLLAIIGCLYAPSIEFARVALILESLFQAWWTVLLLGRLMDVSKGSFSASVFGLMMTSMSISLAAGTLLYAIAGSVINRLSGTLLVAVVQGGFLWAWLRFSERWRFKTHALNSTD